MSKIMFSLNKREKKQKKEKKQQSSSLSNQ